MPVFSPPQNRPPDFWRVFGHSFFQMAVGTRSQAGRADSAVRSMFDIEFNNWANHARNGARVTMEGGHNGGWVRLVNHALGPTITNLTNPYVAHGGAYLLCFGLNELGHNGNDAQYRTAFEYGLDMIISRARVSIWRDDTSTAPAADGSVAYGSAWTNLSAADDFATGSSVRNCNSTAVPANSTFTITLPSNYRGNPIGVTFLCNPGVAGGTLTLGGTAGVTGTFQVSNILPAATVLRCPRMHRITSLTSANAGQTITYQLTQLDASGIIYFDGWWLESTAPPPVLVCNITKLTSVGYDVYATLAANSDSTNHGFVDTWNSTIATVVARYDSMVQIVDCDTAISAPTLGTDALSPGLQTLSFDGLHPSEIGASRIAGEVANAVNRLRPTTVLGATQLNPQSKRSAAITQPYLSEKWYTSETYPMSPGTAYTLVSGDHWAIPFFIGQGQLQCNGWGIERLAGTVAPTMWVAIYDDREMKGYPQYLMITPTTSALTMGSPSQTGFMASAGSGNGSINEPMDPGLYWLTMKIATIGTGVTYRTFSGSNRWMPNLLSTGAMPASTTQVNGWKLTGTGTGAPPGKFGQGVAAAVASPNAPYIALKFTSLAEGGNSLQ